MATAELDYINSVFAHNVGKLSLARSTGQADERLAQLLHLRVSRVLPADPAGARGMHLAVLRETRMPAVLCELGPVRDVVRATPRVVNAVSSHFRRASSVLACRL